jgi:hypothetical protein
LSFHFTQELFLLRLSHAVFHRAVSDSCHSTRNTIMYESIGSLAQSLSLVIQMTDKIRLSS